jgi:H+/Cl- antiporter ClcA
MMIQSNLRRRALFILGGSLFLSTAGSLSFAPKNSVEQRIRSVVGRKHSAAERYLHPKLRTVSVVALQAQNKDDDEDQERYNNLSLFQGFDMSEITDRDEGVGRLLPITYDLMEAGLVGILTGIFVAAFKLSIDFLRDFTYGSDALAGNLIAVALIPAAGGVLVGILKEIGASSFPPGLRGTIEAVDKSSRAQLPKNLIEETATTQVNFFRKSLASVATLGTGNSLGPEGPSVEIGMDMARLCIDSLRRPKMQTEDPEKRVDQARLLLSCGAAAGVSAGFNAPIAGVFFALEIIQNNFKTIGSKTSSGPKPPLMPNLSSNAGISAILIASVLSELVSATFLGNHLALSLSAYNLKTPLLELPLYLALGALSGCVAFAFSLAAETSQSFFAGKLGPEPLKDFMGNLPDSTKPVLGGLFCGFVGIFFPQILFFGYETLNSLLAKKSLSTTVILTLLATKTVTTAVSAGSGLVGGTFAPALFLGAMSGAAFHNVVLTLVQSINDAGLIDMSGIVLDLADVPAYAMVGAASVLAALFRAPLTAS